MNLSCKILIQIFISGWSHYNGQTHSVKYVRKPVFLDPSILVKEQNRKLCLYREYTGQKKAVFWHILRNMYIHYIQEKKGSCVACTINIFL